MLHDKKQGTAASCEQTNPGALRFVRTTICAIFLLDVSSFLSFFLTRSPPDHTTCSSLPTCIKRFFGYSYYWSSLTHVIYIKTMDWNILARVLYTERHATIATSLRHKPKETSTPPQYLTRLLYECRLSSSLWRLTGLSVVTVTIQTSHSTLSQKFLSILILMSL